jgi:cobalt-zinc-cadmium efflux system protein
VHSHSHGHHVHATATLGVGCAAVVSPDVGHEARGKERRALALSLAIAAMVLVTEIIGAWLSHSLSLASDAAHVFADLVAQSLSLIAINLALKPADARRTYGWHRVEILAALANSMVLIGLSFALMYGAARRIIAPVEVHAPIMLGVAAVGMVANMLAMWLLHGFESLNAKGAYLHVLLDTLSSVLVLIGAAVIWLVPSMQRIDPVLSVGIALFIFYSAYRLARDAVHVLLEAVPHDVDLAGVTHAIDHIEGVRDVHDLHIWTITSGMYALSAHIVVAEGQDPGRHDALLAEIKLMLQRDFGIAHTTLQIESSGYQHNC